MKLKEVIGPTPKCPRCKIHMLSRITLMKTKVYDCPKCQAIYEEIKKIEKLGGCNENRKS